MTDTSTEEDQTDIKKRRARGEFVRGVSGFRHAIGDPVFPAEPDRYHLFVALNCPSVSQSHDWREMCWAFKTASRWTLHFQTAPATTIQRRQTYGSLRLIGLHRSQVRLCQNARVSTGTGKGLRLAKEIYRTEGSEEQSLPILYDKIAGRIVNNESAEIVRMLDAYSGFSWQHNPGS